MAPPFDPHGQPSPQTHASSSSSSSLHHHDHAYYYRPGYLYFSFFVWISTTGGRFLAPFLEHQGNLTAEQIGWTLGLQAVVSMALGSVGGAWADARERSQPGVGRVQVMALGIVLGGLSCLLHSLQYIWSSSSFFTSYAWHGGLQLIYAASSVLTIPVLDGATIHFLQEHPDFTKEDYGKERLYGAVGWALIHMVMAPLLDWVGFVVVYPLALASTLAALTTLYQYVYWNRHKNDNGQTTRVGGATALKKRSSDVGSISMKNTSNSSNLQSDYSPRIPLSTCLRLLVGTVYGATFLFAMLTLAQGQAVVDSLVFLFFEYLGSSYTVMGMTVLLTVSFEIPIFRMAPALLERFGSGTLLLVASFSYIVRAVGYSCIPVGHIWYVLGLEPLHGVTYACSQTASVDMAAQSMPKGLEATGQGFMYLTRGLGSCVGLVLGGKAMDTLGPRIMYRVSSAIALIGSGIFAWVMVYCPTTSSESSIISRGQIVPTQDSDEAMTFVASESNQPDPNIGSSIELQELDETG